MANFNDIDIVKKILLGSKIHEDELQLFNCCSSRITDKMIPEASDVFLMLDSYKNTTEIVTKEGIRLLNVESDILIPYKFGEFEYTVSMRGILTLCEDLAKFDSRNVEIIKAMLRYNRSNYTEDVFGPVMDFCLFFSCIGEALGYVQNMDVGSKIPGKNGKAFLRLIEIDRDAKLIKTKGLYAIVLSMYMFNCSPLLNNTVKLMAVSKIVVNHIESLKECSLIGVCTHAVLTEEKGHVEFLDEVQVPETYECNYVKEEIDDVHYGQLKLLIGNIVFLQELKKREIQFKNVYYMGCANSYSVISTAKLLGKNYIHHFVDPDVSEKFYSDLVADGYTIVVNPVVARYDYDLKYESIIFSDVRSSLEVDKILEDNYLQYLWSKRVKAGSYKFKVPYDEKFKSKTYFRIKGDVYLQPYRGKSSQEVRIFNYDPGMYRLGKVDDYYRINDYYNMECRFSGTCCSDCSNAALALSVFVMPTISQVIIPVEFDVRYGQDGSYDDTVVLGDKKLDPGGAIGFDIKLTDMVR
jgi:hypothetical protein